MLIEWRREKKKETEREMGEDGNLRGTKET